jgi:hypothetical protein
MSAPITNKTSKIPNNEDDTDSILHQQILSHQADVASDNYLNVVRTQLLAVRASRESSLTPAERIAWDNDEKVVRAELDIAHAKCNEAISQMKIASKDVNDCYNRLQKFLDKRADAAATIKAVLSIANFEMQEALRVLTAATKNSDACGK